MRRTDRFAVRREDGMVEEFAFGAKAENVAMPDGKALTEALNPLLGLGKTLTFTGAASGSYDGTADKVIHIPKGGAFEKVIRAQAEFEALIASPTWLGAASVCFVGDGGTLKFTRSDGQGCKIPKTVKQIQGINSAIIEITNFVIERDTNPAALWRESNSSWDDFSIDGIKCTCAGASSLAAMHNLNAATNCECAAMANGEVSAQASGFSRCTNLVNCKATARGRNAGFGCAYDNCTHITNCYADACGRPANGTGEAMGFYCCSHVVNCTGSARGSDSGARNGKAYSFMRCENIANCHGNCYSYGTGDSCTYYGCKRMTNCTGMSSAQAHLLGKGHLIYNCDFVSCCTELIASTTAFLGGTNTHVDEATVAASVAS